MFCSVGSGARIVPFVMCDVTAVHVCVVAYLDKFRAELLLHRLVVSVDSTDEAVPQQGIDESYTICVPAAASTGTPS